MEEALGDCDAAIRATRNGRDLVYRRKGELLLRLDRPQEAMSAFDAALGLNPADPEIWCDAARAWRAMGQEGRARKMVDQALRLDPTSPRALDLRSEGAASS
jgi:tetratricopeptide (TPR) repeat protein